MPQRNQHPRRLALLLLSIIAVALIAAATGSYAKTQLQAIAVLKLVAGQPVPTLLSRLVLQPVRSEDIRFASPDGTVRARLYRPANQEDSRQLPGLIVLHGVHHLGMDEPRLVNFASAMASCGLSVLTPQLPGIADYHVGLSDVKVIGNSAEWFASRTGGSVGVLGLSFSGGLALVAAADPAYRKEFKFVFAVGSQDNMAHVANYYVTGQDPRPDGSIERLPPHDYGPLVLEYEHLEDFVPAQDEDAIRPVLREHLFEDGPAEADAIAKLTPAQRAEAAQLMDPDSAATHALLAASNAKHVAEMEALSPDGKLSTMTTPVFLLHGQADNIIPSAETLWIAHQLPKSTLKEELISSVLSHLNLDGAKPTAWDHWRLVQFFAGVLNAAESK